MSQSGCVILVQFAYKFLCCKCWQTVDANINTTINEFHFFGTANFSTYVTRNSQVCGCNCAKICVKQNRKSSILCCLTLTYPHTVIHPTFDWTLNTSYDLQRLNDYVVNWNRNGTSLTNLEQKKVTSPFSRVRSSRFRPKNKNTSPGPSSG
jgi:hypothetical protein